MKDFVLFQYTEVLCSTSIEVLKAMSKLTQRNMPQFQVQMKDTSHLFY